MVEDHIEKNRQAVTMGFVHQAPEIIGPAVTAGRGEQIHAVITPIALAGKIGKRHQLDRGHTELREFFQMIDHGGKRTGRSKCANMQLINHQLLQADSPPVGIRPGEAICIHDFRRAVDSLGLETGSRVGKGSVGPRPLAIDEIAIAVAGAHPGHEGAEGPVGSFFQFVASLAAVLANASGWCGRAGSARSFNDHGDVGGRGRPDPEVRTLLIGPSSQRWPPCHRLVPSLHFG